MTATDLGLKVGDIGFTNISGLGGELASIGLALLNDGCRWEHVFIVVSETEVLEAMSSGSRIAPIDRVYDDEVHYARLPLTDEQRRKVAELAPTFVGRKYSILTYIYLALHRVGFTSRFLKKKIQNGSARICSQIVDNLLNAAGFQLFMDGREWLDVTPGDIFYALITEFVARVPQIDQIGPEFK